MAIKYCAFPDAIVLDKPEGKHVQHLLWGDWLRLKGGKEGDWFEVDTRGEDGWLGRKGWLLILTGGELRIAVELSDLGHKGMCMVNAGEDNIGINMS